MEGDYADMKALKEAVRAKFELGPGTIRLKRDYGSKTGSMSDIRDIKDCPLKGKLRFSFEPTRSGTSSTQLEAKVFW